MKTNVIFFATLLGVGVASLVPIPGAPTTTPSTCSEAIGLKQVAPKLIQEIRRDLQNDNGDTTEVRSITGTALAHGI